MRLKGPIIQVPVSSEGSPMLVCLYSFLPFIRKPTYNPTPCEERGFVFLYGTSYLVWELSLSFPNIRRLRSRRDRKGALLHTDNRHFNKPLSRSFCSFAHSFHSAYSLPHFACSIHGFAHPLTPSEGVKIFFICVHAVNAINGNDRDSCRHWKHTQTSRQNRWIYYL